MGNPNSTAGGDAQAPSYAGTRQDARANDVAYHATTDADAGAGSDAQTTDSDTATACHSQTDGNRETTRDAPANGAAPYTSSDTNAIAKHDR